MNKPVAQPAINPVKRPVAFVTGASSGIGRAIAQKLASDGFDLILLARRETLLNSLKTELKNQANCHIIACDINDHANLVEALKSRGAGFDTIDVLVNNAGLALGLNPAHQADWLDWQTMINTNCLSLAFLTHQLLPDMVKRNHGHIINIGSIAGTYAYKGGNVYGATKAFVEQFSINLRADLLGSAVRVTNIEPGLLNESEFSLVRFKGDDKKASQVYDSLEPLRSEDIGNAVSWIIQQPAHVNINRIEIMPVHQAPGGPITIKS